MQANKKTCFKSTVSFPEEHKTGIASTRLIVEKDLDLVEGQSVQVNWQGKKVQAKILAVSGKCQSSILKSLSFSWAIFLVNTSNL